jgi:hypothetical protein
MKASLLLVPLGIALLAGCGSPSARAAVQPAPAGAPRVERIVPDSGPAGQAYPVEVTIEGTGFADSSNTVTFGPATVRDIPSSESRTRIVMFLPKEVRPSAEAPPMPLLAGDYELRVATRAGVSNAVKFRLTASGQ